MKITIFSEELRKCLNAAGLSDCGENDSWNHWYQRIMKVFNESVDRQIVTEQSENAELRELVRALLPCYLWSDCYGKTCQVADTPRCPRPSRLLERARELGVEVDG